MNNERYKYLKESVKPLKFGTSGLRDRIENMADLEVYINTRGFIKYLRNLEQAGDIISAGGDLRPSTPNIMKAVIKAIEDEGIKAEPCGFIPSPALAYYGFSNKRAAIMVTGSHIPADRNGIKFNKPSGEVLKEDEKEILKYVKIAREEEYKKTWEETLFDKNGKFKINPKYNLAEYQQRVEEEYIKRYTDIFPENILAGKKIVFYQHSSVGSYVMEEIFRKLGSEVITYGKSKEFIPVDTEKVSQETKKILKEISETYKPFVIISADGDADRPLLADEDGNFIPGDKVGAITALFLKPDFVSLPVSTNEGIFKILKENNINVVRTKIGSPHVIKAMNDDLKKNPLSKVLSWEANGGFLTGSNLVFSGGGELMALPTRDAVLPLLITIISGIKSGKILSEFIKDSLPERYNLAGVFDEFEKFGIKPEEAVNVMKRIISDYSPSLKNDKIIGVNFKKKTSYCLIGNTFETEEKSGEELIVEDLQEWKKVKIKLEEFYEKEIKSINILDGIKIEFSDREISHLRPSGNAPEFRNYVTADSEKRAEEFLEKGINVIIPKLIMATQVKL